MAERALAARRAMLTAIASEDGARLRGRWFRLLYSQSLAGQPARLVVRFARPQGDEEHLLPAAGLGRGAWTWLAPPDLARIEILAPAEHAPAIRIDRLAPLGIGRLLLAALRRRPRSLLPLLWRRATPRSRCVAANEAFDLASPRAFEAHARERRRPFEPQGLDAPLLADAASGPFLGFAMAIRSREDLASLARTLAAFAGQYDRGFRLRVGAPAALAEALDRARLDDRMEIATLDGDDPTPEWASRLATDYVAYLEPGDEPRPEAVASLRAFLAHHRQLDILYADAALREGRDGLVVQLKPDWSPAFQESSDYVGRPCLVRRSLVEPDATWRDLPARVAARRGAAAIGHLKRVLFTLAARPGDPPTQPEPALPHVSDPAFATIVVPTRDRVELLRRLHESLVARTPGGGYEVIVVDNGSEDEAALAYLAELEARPATRVLRRPGPFNFSTLVNAGAEVARGDVLVLLNNDCEIVEGDWLARLVTWATRPGIGAVGAKLLYADGTLQHAGVGLGLGGEAGHRDRKLPGDHPGNLRRLTVPHEVSAVTAACLAVRRETFLAVGGFDEALPVAFNDIDFCLRLLARGDRNILEPGAVLIHAESASRGRDEGPRRARFLAEAALFRERWRALILDDPYLHPLFSTIRFYDRLG